MPYDEVLDFVYDNRNHFAELDTAAEALAQDMDAVGGGRAAALERLLAERHDVRTVVADDLSDRRRYDPAGRLLALGRGLDEGAARVPDGGAVLPTSRTADLLARLTDVPGLSGDESRALARIGLASYFAGAVLLPYRAFLAAAEGVGYDIGLLGERFGVSVETVCHRLSTLQRPGEAGVPFVFVRVDRAGNISKRHSATDFHFSRIGGTCPLWNVYEAFSSPDRFITQVAQMPDGRTYLWVASHHRRAASGGYGATAPSSPSGWAATCATRRAWSTRAAWTSATRRRRCRSVPGCRLCERVGCPQRAFPLVGRPLDIDEDRSRGEPYPAR